MVRQLLMTTDTIRENMRMYARVVAETNFSEEDVHSLVYYTLMYEARVRGQL